MNRASTILHSALPLAPFLAAQLIVSMIPDASVDLGGMVLAQNRRGGGGSVDDSRSSRLAPEMWHSEAFR